jgi:hypothetical protein
MKKPDHEIRDVQDARLDRRARLHALLFSGAALATSLLMLAGGDVKLPKSQGE